MTVKNNTIIKTVITKENGRFCSVIEISKCSVMQHLMLTIFVVFYKILTVLIKMGIVLLSLIVR